MPKAIILLDEEIDYDYYEGLPLDPKPSNFGWYKDRLVLIDYGG